MENIISEIQNEILKLPISDVDIVIENAKSDSKIGRIITDKTKSLQTSQQSRIQAEFLGMGPLEQLLLDEEITEIIINGSQSIWYEKMGRLFNLHDRFFSKVTFDNFIERLSREAKVQVTLEKPIADAKWRDFRLNITSATLTKQEASICLRRHPKCPWTFDRLVEKDWCNSAQANLIRELIRNHSNILVVGSTGSGKTSVLSSCLQEIAANERAVIIEDSSELSLPNAISTKLLTREDPFGALQNIDQSFLVKQALRMRPDRLVMGEIRSGEAKDFLMALSTGHSGSWGTLHAADPHQALIRLEMLIQMGAPHWNLMAIRRLIQLSLNYILITGKNSEQKRVLKGIFKITSLEESGFLVEKVG